MQSNIYDVLVPRLSCVIFAHCVCVHREVWGEEVFQIGQNLETILLYISYLNKLHLSLYMW